MKRPLLDRLILPLFLPLGILAVIAAFLYLMSRILLGSSTDAAVAIAGAIATAIFLGAAVVATARPRGQQLVSLFAVSAIALLGGGIAGEMSYDGAEHEEAEGGGGVLVGAIGVTMGDNFFEPEGVAAGELRVAANAEIVFELTNSGAAVHNMRIAGADGEYDTGDDLVSVPDLIRPSDGGELAVTFAETGAFAFRCDFHPVEMTGTITVVEEGAGGGASGTHVELGDNVFRPDATTVAAGSPVTFDLENTGAAIHNMRIAGADGEYDTTDDAVSVPDLMRPGDTGTLVYEFATAGDYAFRCDFHPVQMAGVITAE